MWTQEAYHPPHSHSNFLLFRGGGGDPLTNFFFSVWTCIKPNLVSKIFPFTRGGVPWQKFFFPVWTCIKPNLVLKIFPFAGGGGPLTKNFFPSLNMYQAKSGVKIFSLYWDWVPHLKIWDQGPPWKSETGTPPENLRLGTPPKIWDLGPPHPWLDWIPPYLDLDLGPPPIKVWTDTQSENITLIILQMWAVMIIFKYFTDSCNFVHSQNKLLWKGHCEQGILVDLCVCSYEYISGKCATNWLASPVAFQALFICMHWPIEYFLSGVPVTQTGLWPWMSRMCVYILSLFGLSKLWPKFGLSMYLPVSLSICLHFIHLSTVCTLQEPVLILAFPPIFSCKGLTDCVSLRPILYKLAILFILAQWRLVLPGNTVLSYCSNSCNVVPI